MKRVLFLCTGNSCRSQMTEGFARQLQDDLFEVHSAGLEAHGLNPVGFDAPPRLARSARSEEEALGHYRRVRDEIRQFIAFLPTALH